MPVPEAEFEIDEPLVRSLLADQFPDLAGLDIHQVGEGFDNSLWRVGAGLLARLPRRRLAVAFMENELRWLPSLAPRLPLATSVALRVGRASSSYPSVWSITRWFDARPANLEPPVDEGRAGESLARFMRALHAPAPDDAPVNPFRSVGLGDRVDAFESRLVALDGLVDATSLRRVWDRAVRARAHGGPPSWLHGDLHPMNLLVAGGELRAVVDFGDLCAGDPATDVAGAWMLLDPSMVDHLLDSYGSDDPALPARALGWAALFAVMFLEIGLRGPPGYSLVGERALGSVLAYASTLTADP